MNADKCDTAAIARRWLLVRFAAMIAAAVTAAGCEKGAVTRSGMVYGTDRMESLSRGRGGRSGGRSGGR